MHFRSLLCLSLLLIAPCAFAQEQEPLAAMPQAPAPSPESATPATQPPSKSLLNEALLDYIRTQINTELVYFMINNQNEKYADIGDAQIQELDAQWVKERDSDSKPLISATLTNPLSNYFMAVQAHSGGLFYEIFATDAKGLNVGQSDISSDYWQGDEDKWQKTYLLGPGAVFIDEPEFDDDHQVWLAQVNMTITDPTSMKAIGSVTLDVNLSELERRSKNNVKI